MTGDCLQNPLVFAAGLVAGIVFSIDQSLCCCVDTGIKSAKLATLAKLLVTLTIVALITGGIASGILRSNQQINGESYPAGVAYSGTMDPPSPPSPTTSTTTTSISTIVPTGRGTDEADG